MRAVCYLLLLVLAVLMALLIAGYIRDSSIPRTRHAFLVFSPSGKKLAVGREYGGAEIWDLPSSPPCGKRLALRDHRVPYTSTVRFVDEDTLVAVRAEDKDEVVETEFVHWSVAQDVALKRAALPYDLFGHNFAVTPDNRWLAVHLDSEKLYQVWSIEPFRLVRSVMRKPRNYEDFTFEDTPTDEERAWDRENPAVLDLLDPLFRRERAWSPGGRFEAGRDQGMVYLRNLETGTERHLPVDDLAYCFPQHISADGTAFVSATPDEAKTHHRHFHYWDAITGERERLPLMGDYWTALSPSGDTVAFYRHPDVWLWRLQDKKLEKLPIIGTRLWADPWLFAAGSFCLSIPTIVMAIVCLLLFLKGRPEAAQPA